MGEIADYVRVIVESFRNGVRCYVLNARTACGSSVI
jgi:hypothetical protein